MSPERAEFGIRQLHARYADAVWRQDAEAFVDCFTGGGEWKIAGRHAIGREQIGAQFATLLATSERVLMQTGVPLLHFGAEGVTSRTLVTEIAKLRDGRGIRTIGTYHDWLSAHGDAWRFARRHWVLHYYGAPDLSDPTQPGADFGPPPAMPGADEPSVARTG